MRKTFKYRAYANQQTLDKANHWLDLCRNLYNVALNQRIVSFKQNRKHVSCNEQTNELIELKDAFPEYKDVGSQVLQEVLQRVDKAFKHFFRDRFGFPRYKGFNRYDSFTLKYQCGWKLDGKYLHITKVGIFKLKLSRQIQGTIKTVTMHRVSSDKWHVLFSCDEVPERKLRKSNKSIGIDVGVKSFCVDSNGAITKNPLFTKQSEAVLRLRHRSLSRRVKFSKRWNKSRLLVSKAYEKTKNQRLDFLHKLANGYIKDYGVIYIEKLLVKNLVRNHHLAKSIADSSWSTFFELLSYKAVEADRKLVRVNPCNTSQLCSKCGNMVEKLLVVRIHKCPYCGLIMDRDKNAARNILRLGQSLQPSTCADTQSVG